MGVVLSSGLQPLAETMGKVAYVVKPTIAKLHYDEVSLLTLGQLNEELSKSLKEYSFHQIVPIYPASIDDVAIGFEYKQSKTVVKIIGGYEGVKNATRKIVSELGKPDKLGLTILEKILFSLLCYKNFSEEDVCEILRGESK